MTTTIGSKKVEIHGDQFVEGVDPQTGEKAMLPEPLVPEKYRSGSELTAEITKATKELTFDLK